MAINGMNGINGIPILNDHQKPPKIRSRKSKKAMNKYKIKATSTQFLIYPQNITKYTLRSGDKFFINVKGENYVFYLDKNTNGGVGIIDKEKCEGMDNGYKLNKFCIIYVFDGHDNLKYRLRISPSYHGDKIIICNIDKLENEHDHLLKTGKRNNHLIRSLSTINYMQ